MHSITDSTRSTLAKNKSKQVILMSLIRHWVGDYWQEAWEKCVPPVTSSVSQQEYLRIEKLHKDLTKETFWGDIQRGFHKIQFSY